MGEKNYQEMIKMLVDHESELENNEPKKIDAALFTGICAYVERFLHAKALYAEIGNEMSLVRNP